MLDADTVARTQSSADTGSIRSLFGDTVQHSKAYLVAEREALTLRVRVTAALLKTAVTFGAVAAVLALFGLGWLLVAAVAALAILIGHVLAALVVGLLLLAAAYLCVRTVMGAVSRIPGGSS